jgi:beta-propeller repeat-containing protein
MPQLETSNFERVLTGGVGDPVPVFPTTPGAFEVDPGGGAMDACVAKLSPGGDALVYSTFLGGSDGDQGSSLSVDAAGNVFVAGPTVSADFPVTPGAYDVTPSSNGGDAFAAKLNADGSALLWSTYLGDADGDGYRPQIAVDSQGAAVLTTLLFVGTPGGYSDALVIKLAPDGASAAYVTQVGGSDHDYPWDIAVDADGAAYVVGSTASSDFPVTAGAFDTVFDRDHGDGFVAKLSDVGALVWATYLRSGAPSSLALDVEHNIYVGGDTSSDDFPATAGALDATHNGSGVDGFVAKLDPDGRSLLYGTYLGAGANDFVKDIVVDGVGDVIAVGGTFSADFPVTAGAFDTTFDPTDAGVGALDGFVAKLDSNGSTLLYGSFLGASGADRVAAVALGAGGAVYVAGATTSVDFPTTAGAFDQTYNGGELDGFVVKLDLGDAVGAPPDCGAAGPSVTMLWPPNHGWVNVAVVGVTGGVVTITGVTQDEPTDDVGDGRTCPDAEIAPDGTVALRAERAGSGDGRVYHVAFTAEDAAGESCSGTVSVCVPHDQGDGGCGDGGALYDSLLCGP